MAEIVKNTKHNYKLSPEDVNEIVISYYLNRSKETINDLCTRFNISETWLYQLVKSKQGKEILDRHIIESKKNFSKRLDLILEKTYNRLEKALDEEDIKAKDLSLIGAMTYDKSRLEQNLSTTNNEIHINIKVES